MHTAGGGEALELIFRGEKEMTRLRVTPMCDIYGHRRFRETLRRSVSSPTNEVKTDPETSGPGWCLSFIL